MIEIGAFGAFRLRGEVPTDRDRTKLCIYILNAVRFQERRMVQVPGLVKLRSALTREGVGGACDVMDD